MFKALIKKQLLELFQTYYVNKKTGKARSKAGTVLFFGLLIFLFLSLGFAFYAMAASLGSIVLGHGQNWLYFSLMGLLAMALGVFGSVFNTYASVYLPTDNAFLMSLPIPDRVLLLARVSGVYVTSLMYSAWIWIPITIAYWIQVPLTVCNVIFPLLLTLIVALFVSVLSCILGWVVALIATKTKGKSFVTVFISLFVIAAYYVVYFKIIQSLEEIASHIGMLGSTIKSWLHYSYLLGSAADGDLLSMLLVTVLTVLLAVLCFLVLSKTFTKLALTESKTEKKTQKANDYTQKTKKLALLHREFRHFTSVSTWMLNGGLGLLLLPLAAVAAGIKREIIREIIAEIAGGMPDFAAALPVILMAVVCLIVSMDGITPVSVSMEGRNLWILQSLPMEPWDVLKAKESMAVQVNFFPVVFSTLVLGVVFQLPGLKLALILCAVLVYIWLMTDFGLFLNLKHPNFVWANEATLTKQSMPILINLFGGWFFCVLFGFGGFILCRLVDASVVLLGVLILFSILWALLHRWLKQKGTAILQSL